MLEEESHGRVMGRKGGHTWDRVTRLEEAEKCEGAMTLDNSLTEKNGMERRQQAEQGPFCQKIGAPL